MKIYYIKNDKCIDVVDKLKTTNRVMTYAIPALMTGERLIGYYMRLSHGNPLEASMKIIQQYGLFCVDSLMLPFYSVGIDVTIVSDAMNLLIGG